MGRFSDERPISGKPSAATASRRTIASFAAPCAVPRAATLTPFHAPANVFAMPLQLRDLKAEARNLTRAGQFAAALAAHDQMLAKNPLDSESRRRIADLLFRLGDKAGAVETYRAVAMHDVRSGHLLPALVGCKVLESLGQNIDPIVATMARNFAHGAPTLAKFAARQAPVDLDASIDPPP